jgi:hypothetical protein
MVSVRLRNRPVPEIANRDVTRAIGRTVWPALREAGFESFTGRNAWRYVGKHVDVVNFQSFGGMLADSVGCTSFSFQVNLGLWIPEDAWGLPRAEDSKRRPRPQEYECEPHRLTLQKSLSQPWFRPFRGDASRWPPSFRIHREGLKQVFRSDTHDNAYVWFVLTDGSNLEECVEDALAAIRRDGLPWFDSLRT